MVLTMRKYPQDFPNRFSTRTRVVGKQCANWWHMVGKWLVICWGHKNHRHFLCYLCFSHSRRNTIKRDPVSLRPQVNDFDAYTSMDTLLTLSVHPLLLENHYEHWAISTYGMIYMVKTCQNLVTSTLVNPPSVLSSTDSIAFTPTPGQHTWCSSP